MILMMEIVAVCLLFTLVTIAGTKKNPLSGLHNMPLELQEKVAALPRYEGIEVVRTKKRIVKKIPAMVVFLIVFVLMMRLAGAETFQQGFGYTFLLWTVLKLYVVLVLDCIVYAHAPSMWIPGTEDEPQYYQNYRFYLSSIPRSLLVGAILSALVGGIIAMI